MIIWLASYPRSGNTFFRILLNHLYGIKTFSIYNDPLFEQLNGAQRVVGHVNTEKSIPEMAEDKQLFFVKTHHLPTDNYPAIYLVRDGRDSIVSYANYILSFNSSSSRKSIKSIIKDSLGLNSKNRLVKKLILNSDSDYGNWSENANEWINREAETVVIRFEDLIQKPQVELDSALQKLRIREILERKEREIPSFQDLHAKWPNFFRKGKVRSWESEMNVELQSLFWKHHGEMMQLLNYFK